MVTLITIFIILMYFAYIKPGRDERREKRRWMKIHDNFIHGRPVNF
jgi:hypothetical protein